MISLYTKMYVDRSTRYGFEHLKAYAKSRKFQSLKSIVENGQKRRISAFKLWIMQARKIRD